MVTPRCTRRFNHRRRRLVEPGLRRARIRRAQAGWITRERTAGGVAAPPGRGWRGTSDHEGDGRDHQPHRVEAEDADAEDADDDADLDHRGPGDVAGRPAVDQDRALERQQHGQGRDEHQHASRRDGELGQLGRQPRHPLEPDLGERGPRDDPEPERDGHAEEEGETAQRPVALELVADQGDADLLVRQTESAEYEDQRAHHRQHRE